MLRMDGALKWIGGASAGALALLGSAVVAGHAIAAREADSVPALRAELPAPEPVAAVAPAPQSVATSEPASAPDPTPFVIRSILPIEGAIKYGEWHWDESNAPAEGPLVITVDLEARVLSVFRAGHEIGAAAVLLGTDEHPTPTGVFPILSKERNNVSEKYGNAPMPWSLRLTWDGVAIHGGSQVQLGYASHGCIGTPDDFVSRLFAIAKKGDKVIITRGRKAGLGSSLAV